MKLYFKSLSHEDSHMLIKTAIKAALREWKLAELNKSAAARRVRLLKRQQTAKSVRLLLLKKHSRSAKAGLRNPRMRKLPVCPKCLTLLPLLVMTKLL